MKAIILAAGRGSRMGDLTSDKPKCLLEIKGISLLARQVMALRHAGIDEIGIVTGYRADKLKDIIKLFNLKSFYNDKWQTTNMVYSLFKAEEWLKNDECIVSYADIFYPYAAVYKLLGSKEGEISVLYDKNWYGLWSVRFNNPLSDAESFDIDDDGFVKDIGRINVRKEEIKGQFMGLLKITPEGYQKVVAQLEGRLDIDVTRALNVVIDKDNAIKDKIIKGVEFDGVWGEVDSVRDFDLYNSLSMENLYDKNDKVLFLHYLKCNLYESGFFCIDTVLGHQLIKYVDYNGVFRFSISGFGDFEVCGEDKVCRVNISGVNETIELGYVDDKGYYLFSDRDYNGIWIRVCHILNSVFFKGLMFSC